jgi:iron(III) transport system substrate-binding protein
MRGLIRGLAIAAMLMLEPAVAASLPPQAQALLAAAEKEGEVTVFGTTLNPRQIASFEKSFQGFTGTAIKVNMIGGLHSSKAAEVALAVRNNAPPGIDIFWTGLAADLIGAGAMQKVDWAALGADPSLDLGGYGLRTHDGHPTLVTINTNLVTVADGPHRYQDLLDPKWKGRIAMPRTAEGWAYAAYALGEEETETLLTGLVKNQDVKLLDRLPDVRTRLIGGEFAIAVGTDAFTQIAQGAPVAHADLDMLVLSSTGAFVVTGAAHPNAAKLWALWAASPEGQKILEAVRGYALVETPGTALNAYAQGKKVVHVPFEWRVANMQRLTDRYQKIFDGN